MEARKLTVETQKALKVPEPTPRPWVNEDQGDHIVAFDKNEKMLNDLNSIAICYGPDRKANAKRIVQAVNAFDDLLEECKKGLLGMNIHTPFDSKIKQQLRAAIAKAEGRPK